MFANYKFPISSIPFVSTCKQIKIWCKICYISEENVFRMKTDVIETGTNERKSTLESVESRRPNSLGKKTFVEMSNNLTQISLLLSSETVSLALFHFFKRTKSCGSG